MILHTITTIKQHPRDFSYLQLLAEIEIGQQIQPLFTVALQIVQQADLAVDSIRFNSSLVDYSPDYKLQRMNMAMARLYLLCFVYDRYQRLNDHLLNAFCTLIRRYIDEVAAATKNALYGGDRGFGAVNQVELHRIADRLKSANSRRNIQLNLIPRGSSNE